MEDDYKKLTTFWEDFTIADKFVGIEMEPIQDTYKRGLDYAKTDYKIFTELVLVLNAKIWEWYNKNEVIAKIYNTLWENAEDEFFNTFTGQDDAIRYYYKTTD